MMKNFLANIFGGQVAPQIARQNAIRSELYQTQKVIKNGLSKPLASTGTPISELKGMARTLAMKANVGGGSIASGGHGVRGCDELLDRYSQLVGMAKENDWQNKLNSGRR
ncbi:MAG: hypothetical protein IKH18_10090 [Clostridia bacterium]|nr:hypothetical protein [Clostridia bacterium]